MTRFKPHPDQKTLNNIFEYCASGNLIYKKSKGRAKAGSQAGWRCQRYWKIRVNKTNFVAHRLIYIFHFGPIPPGLEIDHIDGDSFNNCIENLRLATHRQNMRNRKTPRHNTSGHIGIFYMKDKPRKKPWRLHLHGKHIGTFSKIEEALVAREDYFKNNNFHANHGR